ncbi:MULTISPECIES: hypothetical protein [Pseudomonas]|uniref:hypothetical protein n=1 Tax=Pseudomonas TaxID=286 RepID=UPI0009086A3F|nr:MULTISPECIES: hypothetical protein [Pseudomonas]MCK9700674.1 hypothetical protein [Pseudomonas syringae pv. syringae]MCK9707613.1 hypothetical protein [Pseudomonas syringae pv. syringae]MCK9718248.1 hypothetical protein [Pseudomonas syringae pv. syringae]MCK9743284.1 hypothetical protein [Pseudomonas syringae pv. syringae]MCK9755800.1 hypothetical protein [Pseudomonas syringae pv. syringae]
MQRLTLITRSALAISTLLCSIQVQAVLGKDLEVEEGFREKARLNLRLAKLF